MSPDTYSEEAFQYFLDVERKRAARSSRHFLLLLAHLNGQAGTSTPMPGEVANQLFAGLRRCLRETDFLGWYRQEQVVGAVLTQRPDSAVDDGFWRLRERVTKALGRHLSKDLVERVQLQVHQQPMMRKEFEG